MPPRRTGGEIPLRAWRLAQHLGRARGETRMITATTIRLKGISGEVKGKTWESSNVLRAGRLGTLEIVLDDSSVSRRHAEVRKAETGWWVRDLESTNGTYVNGVRLGPGERQPGFRRVHCSRSLWDETAVGPGLVRIVIGQVRPA